MSASFTAATFASFLSGARQRSISTLRLRSASCSERKIRSYAAFETVRNSVGVLPATAVVCRTLVCNDSLEVLVRELTVFASSLKLDLSLGELLLTVVVAVLVSVGMWPYPRPQLRSWLTHLS